MKTSLKLALAVVAVVLIGVAGAKAIVTKSLERIS